ncbi:MAG: murein biosynthesis integral membrane protein MurJ [Alphaproteobacteria bacterium]|jgi:putative peptidoglycan lipid II flippase|nr:murein biosynthesis integral membrane protein MurJ [Alphaproteobacteria bacterium]
MRIIRAMATVGGFTGVSRIFGLIRESLMSHIIGASPITDAFLVAFKFPNFFRRIFAEGAFNASFVPQFSGQLASEGTESAKLLAERVMAVLGTTLILFVLFIVVATPWVMGVIAPGFSGDRLEMAITFTRITFPYILFISISALLSGVLNSLDRFAAAAAAPIILNIIMIGSMIIFSYADLVTGKALSWAVFLSGVLQLVWLYWAVWRTGFRLKIRLPRLTPEVRKVLRLMVPGAIGAGVMNINLLLDMVFASLLPAGSISFLHYADRLNQLPLSLFGVAMGTALLPSLSRQIRLGEFEKALVNQGIAVEVSLQLTIPAALGLVLLSYPIIDLIYGLEGDQVTATAAALAAFATGIPAYVFSKVFATGFFARQDTKTPVKIAVISIVCNLFLNLILMGPFSHVGLAMATSIAAWVNAGLLLLVLHRRGWFSLNRQIQITAMKVLISAAAMGGGLILARDRWLTTLPDSLLLQITAVLSIIICGMVIFGGMGQLTGAFNLTHIRQALRRN